MVEWIEVTHDHDGLVLVAEGLNFTRIDDRCGPDITIEWLEDFVERKGEDNVHIFLCKTERGFLAICFKWNVNYNCWNLVWTTGKPAEGIVRTKQLAIESQDNIADCEYQFLSSNQRSNKMYYEFIGAWSDYKNQFDTADGYYNDFIRGKLKVGFKVSIDGDRIFLEV